jgi:ketopantoate reductase
VSFQGISLSDTLDNVQKADMRAYMSLINTVLANAEVSDNYMDEYSVKLLLESCGSLLLCQYMKCSRFHSVQAYL